MLITTFAVGARTLSYSVERWHLAAGLSPFVRIAESRYLFYDLIFSIVLRCTAMVGVAGKALSRGN